MFTEYTNMDLSGAVVPNLVTHVGEGGADSFMLSMSMDDEDDHGLHTADMGRTGWLSLSNSLLVVSLHDEYIHIVILSTSVGC